jgi:hypothetical protein
MLSRCTHIVTLMGGDTVLNYRGGAGAHDCGREEATGKSEVDK